MPNNKPDTQKNKPGTEGVDTPGFDKNPFNSVASGKPFLSANDKYTQPQSILDEGQKLLSTIRSIKAPNADNPTTASVDPKLKLPEAVLKADPLGKSQILAGMFKAMKMARGIMSSNDTASHNEKTNDALTGALRILCQKHGFEIVILAFETCLAFGKISQLDSDYQDMVKNSLATIIQEAMLNGDSGIKARVIPPVTYGTIVPSPIYTYENIPDLYIQQYYDQESDPYPGYIQWQNPDDSTVYVYSKRYSYQNPYETADDEIVSNAEQEIANSLESYVLTNTLTTNILNTVLSQQNTHIQNQGMEKSLGKNSSINLSLINNIMGVVGVATNLTKNQFLPQSVLSQSSVQQTLDKFNKNIAFAKKMQQATNTAFKLPSPITGLNNLISGLSLSSIVNIGNLANFANVQGLVSSLSTMSTATAISSIMTASGINSSSAINSSYNTLRIIGIT